MKLCWGNQAVEAADQTKEAKEVLESVVNLYQKMAQSLQFLKELERGKFCTRTDNTVKLK